MDLRIDFFPQKSESFLAEKLKTLFAIGGATITIPYAEFLKILGILDTKEAREAYELYKILIEKLKNLS